MPGTGGVPGSFGPSTASLYKKAKTLPKERLREDLEERRRLRVFMAVDG